VIERILTHLELYARPLPRAPAQTVAANVIRCAPEVVTAFTEKRKPNWAPATP
jgi:hypothetical protein